MKTTKYLRETVLGRPFGDELGRGVDEVLSTNVLGARALHGAPESGRAIARAYRARGVGLVKKASTLFDERGLVDLERQLDEHVAALGQHRPRPGGLGCSVEALADALDRYLNRCQPVRKAVQPLVGSGVRGQQQLLLEAVAGVTRLLAKASRRKGPGLDYGMQSLFGAPLLADEAASQAWSQLGDRDRLVELVATWRARQMGTELQHRSDPDVSRLLLLQEALADNVSLGALRSSKELCRWSTGVDPFGGIGPATEEVSGRSDALDWDEGLAELWALIRREERLVAAAARRLAALARGEEALEGRELSVHLIGLCSLWAPTFAVDLVRHSSLGIALDPVLVARRVPRPPSGFATWRTDAVRELARRQGWLSSDIEEPTYLEVALRPLRRHGLTPEAVVRFCETGDASPVVAEIREVDPASYRTRYTLLTRGMDADVDAVTAFGRLVHDSLSSEALGERTSFAQAVFYRYPKVVLTEGTTVRGLTG